MQPPKILGKAIYILGYPALRIIINNSVRSYVVVIYKDQVLLTKNWLGLHNKWRLPGGGVKAKESPVAGVLRELYEEVGLIISKSELVAITKTAKIAKGNYKYWLYELKLNKQPVLNINKHEILEAEFIAIDKLKKLHISEELNCYLKLRK